MTKDRVAGRDVPLLVADAAHQDSSGRRLVDRVGAGQMVAIRRQEMRVQDRVDADQPLHGLIWSLRFLQTVHEGSHRGVGGFGKVRVGTKLGKTATERVTVLSQVPNVATHEEFCGELGRECDPPAEGSHRAFDHVPVVAQQAGGMVGAEGSFQGLRHARQ